MFQMFIMHHLRDRLLNICIRAPIALMTLPPIHDIRSPDSYVLNIIARPSLHFVLSHAVAQGLDRIVGHPKLLLVLSALVLVAHIIILRLLVPARVLAQSL